jgi:anti-sigma factor RsiW
MTVMTMPLDCDEFAAKLADYLDGDLPALGRDAMDAHASTCAECRQLLSELQSLRVDAASLPLLEPSRDLWAGIAERIDARVLPLDAPRAARMTTVRRSWRHPAVAAAALVLITAGITHVWTRYSYETAPHQATPTRAVTVAQAPVEQGPDASGTASVEATAPSAGTSSGQRSAGSVARTSVRSATNRPAARSGAVLVSRSASAGRIMRTEVEPVYDREIVKLRAIVRDRRAQLDPKTVAVLEQSIAVIDSAIAQSRAALAKDPASGFLATQLNHSLEKKVELLRTAALLPART